MGPMQGKAVDDIINEWNAELERRSRAFVKQAEALAEWDRRILQNRHTLLDLEEQLRKVSAASAVWDEIPCAHGTLPGTCLDGLGTLSSKTVALKRLASARHGIWATGTQGAGCFGQEDSAAGGPPEGDP